MRHAAIVAGFTLGCSAAGDPRGHPTDTVAPSNDTARDPVVCDADPLEVELASAVDPFAPFADGGALALVNGPQGGWHVELGARVVGAEAVLFALLEVGVVGADERLLGELIVAQPRDWVEATCTGTFLATHLLRREGGAIDEAFVCSLVDTEVDVVLSITDAASDATGSATVRGTVGLDPDEVAACGAATGAPLPPR